MIVESIRIAFRALGANKLRAALTMLGIIIGVAAVITLTAVGQGVSDYIAAQFSDLGSNLIFVFPGKFNPSRPQSNLAAATQLTLTQADAQVLNDPLRVPGLVLVAPLLRGSVIVTTHGQRAAGALRGVTPDYEQARAWPASSGAYLSERDVQDAARVILLGKRLREELFGEQDAVGQLVKINGVSLRVIGELAPKGGTGVGDEDLTALVPLSTARERLVDARTSDGRPAVSMIMVQVDNADDMSVAAQAVVDILREQHKISYRDEDDFTVFTQDEILATFGQITDVLILFLGVIAGISLLVGGIGIMNIMLVSVTERTREIGLRKAIGARRADILMQFLVEALVLALAGGVLGMALGVGGALAISAFVEGFAAHVTFDALLLSTGCAIAVGLFFGIFPAWRAAALRPIDALRYE
jgi:putative ABC transport system permease protein